MHTASYRMLPRPRVRIGWLTSCIQHRSHKFFGAASSHVPQTWSQATFKNEQQKRRGNRTPAREIKWREILLLQKVGKRQLEMNRLPDSWQTRRLSAIDGNIGTATIMASKVEKAIKSFNLGYPGKQTAASDAADGEKPLRCLWQANGSESSAELCLGLRAKVRAVFVLVTQPGLKIILLLLLQRYCYHYCYFLNASREPGQPLFISYTNANGI